MAKNTMVLAEGIEYSLDCYETKLNNNVLVVGTSGAGKTRSIVKPNILKATGSYIVSDPKGNLYKSMKPYLESQGYMVRKLDFTRPKQSAHYNPFNYIRNTQDILKMAHMMVTQVETLSNDPFWDLASEILMQALIGYLIENRPKHEQNLDSIMKLMRACEIDENNPNVKSPLDRIFDEVKKRNGMTFSVKQYEKFRCAAGRTLKSILISLYSKISEYEVPEILEMTSSDDIKIAEIGQKKTALFVVVSDTDRSLDKIANLFFTQAMNELCYYADNMCEGERLPVPVRFIMDDFATNCCIDQFPRMIASIRSRGISTMLMIQSEAQLRVGYGNDDRTIIGNCDTYVYLGGNDIDTARQVARRIDIPESEVLSMPVGTSWIFRRGFKPTEGVNIDYDKFCEELGWSENDHTSMEEAEALWEYPKSTTVPEIPSFLRARTNPFATFDESKRGA